MVSPGTHLVKNIESQSRNIESQIKQIYKSVIENAPYICHHSDFVVVAIPLSFLHENKEDFALQHLRKLRLTVVVVCSLFFSFRTPSRDIKISPGSMG